MKPQFTGGKKKTPLCLDLQKDEEMEGLTEKRYGPKHPNILRMGVPKGKSKDWANNGGRNKAFHTAAGDNGAHPWRVGKEQCS